MSWGYEREVDYHDWQGVRALEASALPPVIPPRLMMDILADCAFRGMSFEMSLQARQGSLKLLMLLRAGDSSGRELAHRLDEAAAQLSEQLRDCGFTVRKPDEKTAETLIPQEYEMGGLFYAAEKDGKYYVPSDYGKVRPIDWSAVSSILSRAEKALFTVQMTPASLTGSEKQMVRENRKFFEQQTDEEGAAQAGAAAYGRLEQSANEPMLFAATGIFGDETVLREIETVMNRGGFAALRLPKRELSGLKDLTMTAYRISAELAEYGHLRAGRLMPVMRRLSHLMSREMAAAMAALPQHTASLFGMTVRAGTVQSQPIPDEMRDESGILLGELSGRGQKVYLPIKWLPLHAAIAGMPGMGKTTFAIGLMHQLYEKGYPFLIVEPTKTEYRRMIDCVPELKIYTAGRLDLSPLYINPFLPPKGVTLEQFKPSLVSIFTAAFSMTSPLDVIFPEVVNECYTRYGWRNTSTRESKGVTIFGLQEFICVFRETVQKSHYDNESKMNLESGGVYRLQALLNANPVLFDTERSVDFDDLLEHPSLIELDAIDNPEQKSLVMSIILVNLMLVIRRKQVCDGQFKNAIMIDEAHLLLGQHLQSGGEESAKAGQSAVQILQNLVVTIRAYGTGLIFADQSPQKMTGEIVNNCNFKTLFRLENAQDRRMLAQTMGLTEAMMADVRQLDPGQVYIGCSKLPVPLRVDTPNIKKKLSLREQPEDEEIRARQPEGRELPFRACDKCRSCVGGCDYACRSEADFLARTICIKMGQTIHDDEGVRGIVEEREALVQTALQSTVQEGIDRTRLEECTMLHLLRRIRLTSTAATAWIEELYL